MEDIENLFAESWLKRTDLLYYLRYTEEIDGDEEGEKERERKREKHVSFYYIYFVFL